MRWCEFSNGGILNNTHRISHCYKGWWFRWVNTAQSVIWENGWKWCEAIHSIHIESFSFSHREMRRVCAFMWIVDQRSHAYFLFFFFKRRLLLFLFFFLRIFMTITIVLLNDFSTFSLHLYDFDAFFICKNTVLIKLSLKTIR